MEAKSNMRTKGNMRTDEDEELEIRMYTKKELALMYFPDSYPRTAVNHLMSWIHRCVPLWKTLLAMGYHPTSKSFNPRQVKTIFDYLGEP